MKRIDVRIPHADYAAFVGGGLLDRSGEFVSSVRSGGRIALITDENVETLYGDRVLESLRAAGATVDSFVIPPGEESKNWDLAGALLEAIAQRGLDRTDMLVALGGGVVGDLAGFVAGVYLRGVDFVQIPTTLLAQVDSSVGGKTAVDLEAGKNLAGAFVQPRCVIADTATLDSLPAEEWLSGMAEVVKSAVLDGDPFMSWLEANALSLSAPGSSATTHAVESCIRFKAAVVAADEREEGGRESLNLGHTLGHAIEKVAGYGRISHGQAVAEGIRFAARLAERMFGLEPELRLRQEAALDAVGLCEAVVPLDTDALRLAMSSDKKARAGVVRFVLVPAIGAYEVVPVEESVLAEELALWASSKRG